MSGESLPPFKYLDPRRYPARVRVAAGRVISRFRRALGRSGPLNEPGAPDSRVSQPLTDFRDSTYPKEAGIKSGTKEDPASQSPAKQAGPDVGDAEREQAAAALREFLAENSTNVDRAARMSDQAERLEREGIPSDSAHNRAARSREELVEGLAGLRRSLSASGGAGSARALDLEVTKLDPPISPGEITARAANPRSLTRGPV